MRFRRLIPRATAIAAALALMTYGLIGPSPARAASAPTTVATGPVTSVGVSGGCLDVYDYSAALANPGYVNSIGVRNCDSSPEQQFTIRSDGTVEISGMCLATDSVQLDYQYGPFASGSNVNRVLVSSWCGDQWTYNSSDELVNASTGDCLDDADGSIGTSNQLLIADTCTGAATQKWTIPVYGQGAPGGPLQPRADAGASGSIASVATLNGCLDVLNNATSGPALVGLETCKAGQEQYWTQMKDGTIQANGLCLDVVGSDGRGARAAADTCNGQLTQQWTAENDGALLNGAGSCLEAPYGYLGTGTALPVNACNAAASQQWLVPMYGKDSLQLTGGDITVSANDGGLDPTVVQQVINTELPGALGLPAGSSVNETVLTGFTHLESDLRDKGELPPGNPELLSLPDESVSVNGSTISLTVPQADLTESRLQARVGIYEWAVQIIATTVSNLANVLVAATCFASLPAASPVLIAAIGLTVIGLVCGGIGSAVNYLTYFSLYYALDPGAIQPSREQTVLASSFNGVAQTLALWTVAFPLLRIWTASKFATLFTSLGAITIGGAAYSPVGIALGLTILAGELVGAGQAFYKLVAQATNRAVVNYGPGQITSKIQSAPSGLCLDNSGGANSAGTSAGNPAVIWNCLSPGDPGLPARQNWSLWSNNIITDGYGECLTASGSSNGSGVIMADCTDGATTQTWTYNSQLQLVNQGLCLDDPQSSNTNHTQLEITNCSSPATAEQQWTLPPAADTPSAGGTPGQP